MVSKRGRRVTRTRRFVKPGRTARGNRPLGKPATNDYCNLKEMQGEGGEQDRVVLFLATGAFDVFAREEPSLLLQIDIFPFGLQQLANPA